MLAALEANLHLELRWHGAGLDRLLDERHAAACGVAGNVLREAGWEVAAEVSFSIYGERGSVDLLGGHAATGTVLVSEVKSDIGSGEQRLRSLDVKTRLATQIAEDRFGWRPRSVARVLIVIASTVNRDRIARLGPLFGPAFPTRGVALRRWLRAPQGSIAGLWFVGLQRPSPARHPGRERIRVPAASAPQRPRRERPWGNDA